MRAARAWLALAALSTAGCGGDPAAEARPSAPAEAPAAEAPPPATKKVLLIGIDGVRPDVLATTPTPNLDALIAGGAFSDSARTGFPTLSGPSWASMLTGVWREKHGVRNNDFPFPDNALGRWPDFLTRLERTDPGLVTFAAADWLPLVSAEGGGPVIGDGVDEKVILDGYELGWAVADERSVSEAERRLREQDPDALFVYVGDPDEVSHETKGIGEPYRAAIAIADGHVGRLVDAVRSRATYADEDWLVLVSTDHGRRADGGHGGGTADERGIFFLAWGPSVVRGRIPGRPEIVDVAATALAHMGLAIDPAWELDGEPLGLARRGAGPGQSRDSTNGDGR